MTSNQQRAALQRQSWAIANDVRGAVGGWDFKQFFWKWCPGEEWALFGITY